MAMPQIGQWRSGGRERDVKSPIRLRFLDSLLSSANAAARQLIQIN
jgi:hypothetical protein